MLKLKLIILLLIGQALVSCKPAIQTQSKQSEASEVEIRRAGAIETYKTESLVVRKISENVYEHTTFLNTKSFGKVPCNGMIVVNNNEAVIFDTPTTDENSQELINYLTGQLNCKVKAVVATHFHEDCLGGLAAFYNASVPSYASYKTIELAKQNNALLPQIGFDNQLELEVGTKKVYAQYFGEGHTRDNVVGYVPGDEVLFGGCLVKETGAGKGNLADANTNAWAETVKKVKLNYPQIITVIPGHGEIGGAELLDYTIQLFE
jgi:metallo-beta-lactamase class B